MMYRKGPPVNSIKVYINTGMGPPVNSIHYIYQVLGPSANCTAVYIHYNGPIRQ